MANVQNCGSYINIPAQTYRHFIAYFSSPIIFLMEFKCKDIIGTEGDIKIKQSFCGNNYT
jgi:hypothetical protein